MDTHDNPQPRVALSLFLNTLAINRATMKTLFDAAFASEEKRNRLYREEVVKAGGAAPHEEQNQEWLQMVGLEMMNDDMVRKTYSGTVVTAHNDMLQRFSAGLRMPNGIELRVGPSIRGVRASHVLWGGRNMVQHHSEWERKGGEEFVQRKYADTYEILRRVSRGGGVMAVNALDVLIRLTEPERSYENLERVVYQCAVDIVRQKWPQ
jgi:hypothetical protein